MELHIVAKLLGFLCLAIAGFMLPSMMWAIHFGEWGALLALCGSAGVALTFGGALVLWGRNATARFFHREGLAFVGLGWLLAATIGALPFLFAGVFGPVDAFFESISGFTTTGSTVLTQEMFNTTPKSIMFWRSFTHWLGGMGIIVLVIAVLPYLGAGGKQLFRSEAPGPNPQGLRPRIRDTATILYTIYFGFTVAQTLALMLAGLSFYDALCNTFGTLATGGFSPHPESIAGYNNVSVELIILFFMICAGSNFALYFALLRRRWAAPLKDTEWKAYIAILALATLLIALNLRGLEGRFGPNTVSNAAYETVAEALRYGSFQVVSLMTTTGFCTADFDQWPHFSRMLLVVLMFIGGSAGSTGGGIKVVRIIVLAKMTYRQIELAFRPKTVRVVRINNEVIDERIQKSIFAFFVIWVAWFTFGAVVMSAMGLPFEAALTSVAATLNNIGPGLDAVGATMDYSLIPVPGKLFLSLSMVLGRLELFSILVLFTPAFWRHD